MLESLRRWITKGSRGEPIVVVSGLPRSGTSMMMRMLEAGGLGVLSDGERTADVDNPKGYFELERQAHGNVEIVYIGLLPDFVGRGLGARLLAAAIERAWAPVRAPWLRAWAAPRKPGHRA